MIFKGRGYWVPIIAAMAMLFSSQIADYAFALLGLPRDGLWYVIALLIYTHGFIAIGVLLMGVAIV